ncbi:MAG: MMPL family transporter [Magnetococcales bacterium]|nr:MMPL family transporter [Magnetococcales bacterium]
MSSDHAPDRPLYNEVVKTFGADSKIILYIRDPNIWQPDKLALLTDIHQHLEQLSFVTKVDSIINAQSIGYSTGVIASGPLLSNKPNDPFEINRARENAMSNPLLAGQVISDDGQAVAFIISYEEQKWNKNFSHNAFWAIEELIKNNKSSFKEIFQVGSPRLSEELKKNIIEDLLLLAPISALVLGITIIYFIGTGFAAVLPVLTSIISLFWTFGIMGWFGIPITVLTSMLPSLVLVIGATEDTHMLSSYLGEITRLEDKHRLTAVRSMLRHIGLPLLLTVATTALGFFSNMLSDIEMIRDFAMITTIAIFFNGIVTLMLTPMVLSFFGPTKSKIIGIKGEILGLPGLILRIFDKIICSYGKVTIFITVGLLIFFANQAMSLHVTNDPLSYFQKNQPLILHTERIHEDFAGVKTFFIYLDAKKPGAFKDPKNIIRLKNIQGWLNKQGQHDSSQSLADILSLLNREFHKGQANKYTVPSNQNLVEQYLLFVSRKQLSPLVNADFSAANIIVRHNINDSHALNTLVRRLKKSAQLIAGVDIKLSVLGDNLMVNAAADNLIEAQIKSLGLLLAVIFVLMSLLFTSLKGGLISLVPNLIPIILVFGIMGLLDLPINPGTAMVAVIAVGIAVDDTIHLLSQYTDECRKTSNLDLAVRRTVREQAIPIISTSIALMMGFLVLSYSNFSIISQFGQLSAATLFFALVADLLITPIILRQIRLVGFANIMALKVRGEVVEKSPLFLDMSLYEVKKTILISEMKQFNTGELLIRHGERGKSLGLILNGSVAVMVPQHNSDGYQQVAVLKPGEIFGEIGFIRSTMRVANIQALEPVEILVFDFHQLQQGMKFFPAIAAKLNLNICRILGNRIADILARKG